MGGAAGISHHPPPTCGPRSVSMGKGKGGKWYFRLKAGNNQIVLASQAYAAKSGAEKGVASVKKNGKTKANYEVKVSKKGDPYFVLHAKGGTGSGSVIGVSETYQGGVSKCKKAWRRS